MGEFDRWLERELSHHLAQIDPGYVAPRYLETKAPRRGPLGRLLYGVPALAGAKLATAGILLAAAASTGVAVDTVATGQTTNWGQHVVQQVEKCKQELGSDQHGIGQCVSQLAKQHGDDTSDQNGQGSPTPGNGGTDNGNGNGGRPSSLPTPQGQSDSHPTPQGQAQGQSGSHPTPPPHPTPNANANGNAGSGSNNAGGNGKP
ncbi:MAG TPA: hypothetical protein VFC09_02425 [Candidatus Dormibacteraeota bacterium]|nr:hypothetical protein [Candidatus Dormibacteraeota bacterium]